jgi:ABC-2 type transport system permease protein
VQTETLREIGIIAARSVRRTLRQPALIIPTILFPLMLLAINASGLNVTKNIPNFPADSYLDFALVVTFMQGGCSRRRRPAPSWRRISRPAS